MKHLLFIFFFFVFYGFVCAQPWPGPAETPGSDAISANDHRFKSWANKIASLSRGPVFLENPGMGHATAGLAEFALGKPDFQIISLGDGGAMTLQFPNAISNGPGPDFAVFENSFSDSFLELAKVLVSSNGIDFFEFPSFSETDTSAQIGAFDSLRAENIQGLAGKYRAGFGTPFDLETIENNSNLDKMNIQYVQVIDVVGSVKPGLSTRDSKGRPINEPYPTPFPSSGFDLDAIGVINQKTTTEFLVKTGPVIFSENQVKFFSQEDFSMRLIGVKGQSLGTHQFPAGESNFSFSIPQGLYLIQIQSKSYFETLKIVIQ